MSQEESVQVENTQESSSSSLPEETSLPEVKEDTTVTETVEEVEAVLVPKVNVWHLRQQQQPAVPSQSPASNAESWPTLADQQVVAQTQGTAAGSASPSSTSSQQPKGRQQWVPLKLDIHYASGATGASNAGSTNLASASNAQKTGRKSNYQNQPSNGRSAPTDQRNGRSHQRQSQSTTSAGGKPTANTTQQRGQQPQQNRRSQSYQRNSRPQQSQSESTDSHNQKADEQQVAVTSPPASPGGAENVNTHVESHAQPADENDEINGTRNSQNRSQSSSYNYQSQNNRPSNYNKGYSMKSAGARGGPRGHSSQHYNGGKKYPNGTSSAGTYFSTYPQQAPYPPHTYYPSPTPSSASSSNDFQPFTNNTVPQQPLFFQPPPPPMFDPADPNQAQFLMLQQQQQPSVLTFIQLQIEFYFSPENLVKDLFFRSKMNEEGYISVQLIAGFNRVRAMCGGNLNMVRAALAQSSILEVGPFDGEEGMGVRLAADEWSRWILPKKTEPASAECDTTAAV